MWLTRGLPMGRAWDNPPTFWSFDEYLRGIPAKARKLACTDGGVKTREWFDATQRVVARICDITASFHWTSLAAEIRVVC